MVSVLYCISYPCSLCLHAYFGGDNDEDGIVTHYSCHFVSHNNHRKLQWSVASYESANFIAIY